MLLHLLCAAAAIKSRAAPSTPTVSRGAQHLTRTALLRVAATISAASAAALGEPPAGKAIPPMADVMAAKAQEKQAAAAPSVLYTPPSIKGLSSPEQIALADHLSKQGAKFYGAYWCSFCLRQRDAFGAGGARRLPYIECATDGYQSQTAACRSKPEVTGYPTWEIGGKFYGGLKSLSELQRVSGFDPSVTFAAPPPPPAPPPRPPPPPGGYRALTPTTPSTPTQLALAQHLKRTGAQFYGAYWCRFCGQQRGLFGKEGVAALPYVECAADGYQSNVAACKAKAEVRAYPTWQINGEFYSGMQSLDELAELSGFTAKTTLARVEPSAKPARGAGANALGIDMTGGAPTMVGEEPCALDDGPENCKK